MDGISIFLSLLRVQNKETVVRRRVKSPKKEEKIKINTSLIVPISLNVTTQGKEATFKNKNTKEPQEPMQVYNQHFMKTRKKTKENNQV